MAMGPIQARPPRRNDGRTILHFDYDCFYAQVVQNRAPSGALVGRCVGVTQKSILATANYEARRRGVKKLMRITEARRICPDIVLVDGEDLSPFRDVSKQLYRMMSDTVGPTAPVERLGLDEMFVDATALIDANLERFLAQCSEGLDKSEPRNDFFVMSDRADGTEGFTFDGSSFAGCVVGDSGTNGQGCILPSKQDDTDANIQTKTRLRLLLGSHLAAHLRHRLEHEAGYTSSAGIATSKLLSKLAGKVNKPANQTTLVSAAWAGDSEGSTDPSTDFDTNIDADADAVVWRFMDPLPLRSVPGIGFKTSSLLSDYFHSAQQNAHKEEAAKKVDQEERRIGEQEPEDDESDACDDAGPVTVVDIRTFPGMSPRILDSILCSTNSTSTAVSSAGNIPTGLRVWQLLHGVDDTPVRGGRDLPSQISIEDTYAGSRQGTLRPDAAAAVANELRKLATSLLRRMHVDLLDKDLDKGPQEATMAGVESSRASWLTRPRTLRLTVRPQMPQAIDNKEPSNYFARMSHSQPLPSFVLNLATPPEQIVDRLVAGTLVPMFRKLAASVQMGKRATVSESATQKGGPAWTVGLLNVCVANMAAVAGPRDDIAALFKRQHDVSTSGPSSSGTVERRDQQTDPIMVGYRNTEADNYINDRSAGEGSDDEAASGWVADEDENDTALEACGQCGHLLPVFAHAAHARFHLLGD